MTSLGIFGPGAVPLLPHLGEVPPDIQGSGERQMTSGSAVSEKVAGSAFGACCTHSGANRVGQRRRSPTNSEKT
jgi:hypothetical protein